MLILPSELCDVEWDIQIYPHETLQTKSIFVDLGSNNIVTIYLFFNTKRNLAFDKFLLELDLREKFISAGFSSKAVKELSLSSLHTLSYDRLMQFNDLVYKRHWESFKVDFCGIRILAGRTLWKELSNPYVMWASTNVDKD